MKFILIIIALFLSNITNAGELDEIKSRIHDNLESSSRYAIR
jgi:hypothetical protein